MQDGTGHDQESASAVQPLEAKEQLLKEVHHRVKNTLQVILSLLNLQAAQIQEGPVLILFQESRNRVQAIAAVHESLYKSKSLANLELSAFAQQLVPDLVRFYGLTSRVETTVRGEETPLEPERAVPFGMLLNELVSNACKHAFAGSRPGQLTVLFEFEETHILMTVADDGPGMPAGLAYENAPSLGLKLIYGLVRQIRGTVSFQSDAGTKVRVRFPVADKELKGA